MTIYLVTAPSGCGKTTLVHLLARQGFWNECISHTTRKPREGEIKDKTYYFTDNKTFLESLGAGWFVEHVTYDGCHYGISEAEILRVGNLGRDIVIIVENDGYKQIKDKYPDAVGIFLHMSKEDCMANMLLRGDSIDKAINRIKKYEDEMKNRNEYDYVIKNVRGKLDDTATILKYILKQHKK